ncbi:MAG: diguanylate cyclase (GGDEF)-like protein, partial [Arenicella sp.]
RGLLKYIESAKDNFEIDNTPFCLLLIDFDYFKKLNDTLGHEVGDRVLVDGSQKMTSAVRTQDYVGRWGGEEFLILLNNTTISEAKDIAEGVRVVISELISQNIGTKVTVSIGVSQFLANETIEKSINRADEALYRAKDSGRNCVELAE